MKAELYPPGPKTRFSATVMLRSVRNPIDLLLDYSRYGDIVHWRFMNDHFYLLNHPDYIKEALTVQDRNFHKAYALQIARNVLGEGLLTSEGEFHHRQRRLIQPAFHHQQIANYAAVMTHYASRARSRWSDNQTIDIHREMMRLTLAIIGKTLFDADLEGEAEAIGRALAEVLEGINRATLIPLGQYIEKIPTPTNRAYERAQKRLDATIYRIIAERRAGNKDRGDLLSTLLEAEEEGGRMTDTQVRDEAMTLLLAGHETTANALTWAFYLLSQNPGPEAKLHEELAQVLQGRVPTFQDVHNLPYTRMVLTETMRLYPPAWVLGREVIKPTRIGGYLIPKGAAVFMSQFVIHHDPRFYPEPYQFRPERWSPDEEKKLPRFAYFPFSGGPRSCVGEQFAWMEGILLLATLAQEWQMQVAPGHRVAMLPRITLRPKYGMQMIVTKRNPENN